MHRVRPKAEERKKMAKTKTTPKATPAKRGAPAEKKTAKQDDTPSALIAAARNAAFVSTDPAKALAHFTPLANAVSTDGLTPFNGSPLVMLSNVKKALAA